MDKNHIFRIYYYPNGIEKDRLLCQEATAEYYKMMGSNLKKFKKGEKFNIFDEKSKKPVMVLVNEAVKNKEITELHVTPTINFNLF